MGKIINITDRLDNEQTTIQIGDKEYAVNNQMDTVLKFEELLGSANTGESMVKSLELALGKEAAKEIDVKSLTIKNFKTIIIAVLAAMQDIDYEEAAARFQDR